jgi:MinD-like ATPase involved in chromosome partitioning or flagellar assembly
MKTQGGNRMSKTVSIHSFRGGTGKSNTTANLAALVAASGRRVGVVDTDVASPGIHVLFGLDEERIAHSLNDYRCDGYPGQRRRGAGIPPPLQY